MSSGRVHVSKITSSSSSEDEDKSPARGRRRSRTGSGARKAASAGSDPGDAFLAGMAVNRQFPNGSLLLTLATKAMEGAYTCTATNGVKYDIRKTINVTVNGEFTVFFLEGLNPVSIYSM